MAALVIYGNIICFAPSYFSAIAYTAFNNRKSIKIQYNSFGDAQENLLSGRKKSIIHTAIISSAFHGRRQHGTPFTIVKSASSSYNNNNAIFDNACPPPARLRKLLEDVASSKDDDDILVLPCCYDGLTARLVARAGFNATFMTGFGVSAVNGYPDTQLVSYDEMLSSANTVAEGLSSIALEKSIEPIPCIAVRFSAGNNVT